MYYTKLVIPIIQNNCYSKFLKLLENNVNLLNQNHFIKKQNICSANKYNILVQGFPILKCYTNSRPSLTISKNFYFKRYYYMSEHLKTLYESQNHARIDSRSKLIRILYIIR